VLCDSQEGFRRRRSTQRQLANLLNALEDAKHCHRNVYCTFIDLSNAFDSLDHDKLLQLMWDQGFPAHAVEVVKGLYTGATTTILTNFGESAPIDIERGTLQGDSLSPFLFLLFIDPLLRWLHVGGRGYQHGCMSDATERGRHACAAPAFADDLALLTGSAADMRTQADKVTAYMQWSGMAVNHAKSGTTGMLYGAAASGLLSGSPLHWGNEPSCCDPIAVLRRVGLLPPIPLNPAHSCHGAGLSHRRSCRHNPIPSDPACPYGHMCTI